MGRSPWIMSILHKEKKTRKGPWTLEEDTKLISYVRQYGAARWSSLAKLAGLKRDGKSCRMRWLNYLRPDLKHGPITSMEEHLIIQLHKRWGNKWSRIADNIPGRTDNEIKNHWKTHIMKMSPQLIGSCSSPQASKTQGQLMAVRENNEASSSKSFECQEMHSMKECHAENAHELHTDGYGAFTCEEINQELILRSSDYAEGIGQISPICYLSSVADSPLTVFSDSEEFSWDYNYVPLWNLDDVVHSMHD